MKPNTLFAAMLAGTLPASAAVVSTIDPDGDVTLGTSTSGNQISMADMQAAITAAGDLTLAGVLNADGVTTAGDFSQDADFGTLQLGISGASRYGRTDGAGAGVPTSGGGHGWINTGPETWTLTAPAGGLVTHFGLTGMDGGQDLTVTANFSGGGSDNFSTSTSGHYFIGFVAPSGESITSVTLQEQAGGAFFGYDDVSFVSVPEPSSTALLGLGGLALMLRRRK